MNRLLIKIKVYLSFGILVGSIFIIAVPMGWIFSLRKSKIEENRLTFHKFKARFFRFYVKHCLFNITSEVSNESGEDFQKPALILVNHQSLLDLPAIMMLHPHLVVMAGDWVWNSRIYGRTLRFAEFFPASMPLDEMRKFVASLMSRGYSVVVFPEGTRSVDLQIQPFRSGAFFLAEYLKCDVVPVTIWGSGKCMPKTDFVLKGGHIVMNIGKRIRFDDGIMGEAHRPMMRYWHNYFIRSYAVLESRYDVKPG